MRRGFVKPIGALIALAACPVMADARPREISHYFYYFHGKIVEDLGPRGVSPRYGAYDYPGIIAALNRERLTVVSEVRPKDTDPGTYADMVVHDIQAKLRAGVPASHITVAGASKGAVIAAIVSTRLKRRGVRYVLIANCNDWLLREIKPKLTGEVLSIFEASDEIGGSCVAVVKQSPGVTKFTEIRLTTGLGHGVVYRPLAAWIGPAAAWALRLGKAKSSVAAKAAPAGRATSVDLAALNR